MINARLIIMTFLLANDALAIEKEARTMNVMGKLEIVTAFSMSQDKNVTNVYLDTLIFLIAKVSIITMMATKSVSTLNCNPQNVNVFPLEPWKILLAQMMGNVHHANPVTLEQNVRNVLMDTLNDQMEVVKSVIVNVLDP